MDTEGTLMPYEQTEYFKSNFLIGAKYKSTLLENKIMAISLSHIQNAEEDMNTGALISKIPASELRELMGVKGGSFYNQLDKAAKSMTGKTIGMSNPEKKVFDYIAVIIRAHYEGGIFTLEYNPHMKSYIQDIKQNFTILNLPTMLEFDSVYSFRLYELLKSKAYYPKGIDRRENVFKISFSVSELKLNLGVVNAELDKVKKALHNSKTPDYDKAIEISPEKVFETWYEFKRRALDIAVKEINKKTDMEVTYNSLKSGRGGKVYQIDFIVELNKEEKKADELSQEDKDNIIDEIFEFIEEPVKLKDIRAIVEAAEYDKDKVKKAYDIMKNSNSDINNMVGFMIKAIKDNFSLPVSIKKDKNPSTAQFNQFMHQDYDIEALEKELLNN